MLVGVGKLLGELSSPTLAGRLRSRLALPRRFRRQGPGGLVALLDEQEQVVATVCGPKRDHLEADLPYPAIRLDPDALRLHRPPTLGRPLDRLAECGRQTFPRHLEEVEARRARRCLEVGAGLPAEL